MSNITPGSRVTVKVVKTPTSAAGRKTLVRILSGDKAVQKENRRLFRTRRDNATPNQRGGRFRLWEGRVKKQAVLTGTAGEQGTILATVETLQSLASVQPFIQVSQA